MDGRLKAVLFAAMGGAVPIALSTIQNCGSDPMLLLTQSLAGMVVAVGSLYAKPPKPGPTTQDRDDETPPPGGN